MTKPMIVFWSSNASKNSSLPKIEHSVKNINLHVPSDKLVKRICRKERGNFHVPSDKTKLVNLRNMKILLAFA